MILCHKDAGLLAARKDENVEGLLSEPWSDNEAGMLTTCCRSARH